MRVGKYFSMLNIKKYITKLYTFIGRYKHLIILVLLELCIIVSCNSQKGALIQSKTTYQDYTLILNRNDTLGSIVPIITYNEVKGNTKLVISLRVLTSFEVTNSDIKYINKTLIYLNSKFDSIGIVFNVVSLEKKDIPYIEELSDNLFDKYYKLSRVFDVKDTLSLWIVENDEDKLCTSTEYSITCNRQSGWANVANTITNNIVISRFDLTNRFVIAHEFGHYFGLEHTFEKWKYGEEAIDGSNCSTAGDRICDTPADPYISEIYVSYSECELFYKGYKPMINNMMNYYKPCVNKEKEFTEQQYIRMYQVANTIHRHNVKEVLKKY